MTKEQREVFDALDSDNEEGIYETIEDNFVDLANEGEDVFVEVTKEKEVKKPQIKEEPEKVKKVHFDENIHKLLDEHIKDRNLED